MITPEQINILKSADLRNIAAKVKAGKPLTANERKTLEAAGGATKNNDPATAKRWGVSAVTVFKWRQKGYPVDNDFELAKVIRSNPKSGAAAIRYAKKVLALFAAQPESDQPDEQKPNEAAQAASATDSTQETQATTASGGSVDDLERTIGILQERLQLYNEQINDHRNLTTAEVKMWAGLVNDTAKAVVANRLAQKKLGMEVGETLSKGECIRIAHAIASRLAVGVQSVIKRISPQVAGMETAAQVAKAIESACIEELMVAPMLASVNIQSGVSLPPWFVDAIKTGIGNFVED